MGVIFYTFGHQKKVFLPTLLRNKKNYIKKYNNLNKLAVHGGINLWHALCRNLRVDLEKAKGKEGLLFECRLIIILKGG